MDLSVNIRKKLRDFVLNVNFTAHDEVFALLGASGCGKSMTLKCIAGIETPDFGRIILNGRILFDSEKKINLPPQKRRVGYLFQNYALFPNMTVSENILFAAVGDDTTHRMKEYLQQFQLIGLEHAYPHELSGGQQQRVAFVRILISHAEILLLDEPFAAIDDYLKWQLELNLAQVLKLHRNAVILVSHDKGEVYRLADRIAVMSSGKIDDTASKRDLFDNPKTLAATLLIGCKNISAAKKIDAAHILAEDWQMTLSVSKKIPDNLRFVGINAEDVRLAGDSGENIFPVEIVQVSEDLNALIVMAKLKDSSAKPIRWDVEKIFRLPEDFCLQLPPEKLILLES